MTNELLSPIPKVIAPPARVPAWAWILIPTVALIALIAVFAFGDPLALFKSSVPPVEDLTVERIVVTPGGFRVTVVNGGAAETTIAQVMVDDAFWQFEIAPGPTLPRLGHATITLAYPGSKPSRTSSSSSPSPA